MVDISGHFLDEEGLCRLELALSEVACIEVNESFVEDGLNHWLGNSRLYELCLDLFFGEHHRLELL